MKTKIAFMGVVAAWAAFADNGVTNTFTMTTANTPLTAYDYETLAGAGDIAVTPFPGDARPYKVTVDSEGVALRIMRNGLCITFK